MCSPPLDLEAQPAVSLTLQQQTNIPLEHQHNRPPRQLTRKQLCYIFVPQGMGAAIIDATFNFAIACAMYRTTSKEIRLWPLNQNTIAGDMGVTVIIQGILTTLIASALVRGDVLRKHVDPFPFAWPDVARWRGKSEIPSWKGCIGAGISFLSPTQTLSLRHGLDAFAKSFFIIVVRGFLVSALYFVVFWPLAIAITAPLFGGVDMRGTWTPEIIKAVFGGTLGLFMNPFIAVLVLGSHAANEDQLNLYDSESIPAHTSAANQQKPRRTPITPSRARITSTALIAKSPAISDSQRQSDIQ